MVAAPPQKKALPKGMLCPNCGSRLFVIETRLGSKDTIIRRRACANDSYRVTTRETVTRKP